MKPTGVRIAPEIEQLLAVAHSKKFKLKSTIMREGEGADSHTSCVNCELAHNK